MDETEFVPRYGIGAFMHGFKEIFMKFHGYEPDINVFGKPELGTFKYIEEYVMRRHPSVRTIYMIGDNLQTDIRGGNTIAKVNQTMPISEGKPNWVTIAVKTGVFKDSGMEWIKIN